LKAFAAQVAVSVRTSASICTVALGTATPDD
jgi:hypothetical protein